MSKRTEYSPVSTYPQVKHYIAGVDLMTVLTFKSAMSREGGKETAYEQNGKGWRKDLT